MKMCWLKTLGIVLGTSVLAGLSVAALPQEAQIKVDRGGLGSNVTVKYKGKTISLMELRVNGKSMGTREVNGKLESGEASFSMDLEALVEGENLIEVRLFDKAGTLIGAESTRITVDKLVDGPVKIDGLKNGQTVQGFVDIKLGFKRAMGNVYVSFFVNGEFKTLRNVPPFSYMWDTAGQANGWYELEAWVVDDRNQTMKTNKIRVFVNNPGGRTERVVQTIPPVTKPVAKPVTKPVTKPVVNTVPVTKPVVNTIPVTKPVATTKPVVATRPVTKPVTQPKTTTIPAENRVVKPVMALNAPATPVKATPLELTPTTSPVRGNTGAMVGTKALKPEAGQVAGQRNLTPTGSRVVPVKTVATPVKTVVAPVKTVAQITPKIKPTISTVKTATSTLPNLSVQFGSRMPNIGQFTILLNNQIVNFDVMPRVVEGIPLTPFRHLFEQAGGKVSWQEFEKVMTATGLGREIWVKVGDKLAKVNGKSITLEMKPFLEKGRTIVPLSFVSETLNVNVQYDPNTGHVLITESKKGK